MPGVITSLCLDTVSARMGVVHLLLPAQLPGTHWAMICVMQHLALTVSDVWLKLGCFQSTSTYSTLEALHGMRYINYLLTLYYIPSTYNMYRWNHTSSGSSQCVHEYWISLIAVDISQWSLDWREIGPNPGSSKPWPINDLKTSFVASQAKRVIITCRFRFYWTTFPGF